MRKLKLFFAFMLMAVLSIGQMWAVDYDLVYTLDGTITESMGSSDYANAGQGGTQNGIKWMIVGNTTQNPWRIGGKNLSGVDRTVHSTDAMSDDIAKIEITHGAASNITVNSMTVVVSKNSDFSNPVSTLTPTFVANNTVIVNRPSEKDWSNCYYKIIYNVSVSGKSNRFIQFTGANFYKEQAASDVATPTFSPAAGVYTSAQSVTLSCETASSTIYYTTDGSDPDNTKTQYTSAINVDETTTIKAIAYVGSSASNVASATYTIVTPLTTMAEVHQAMPGSGNAQINVAITNWVVTGVSGNQVWITDADNAKGILLYKSGHNFEAGKKLNGVVLGTTITKYNNAPELTSLTASQVTVTTADDVNPVVTTIASLTSNFPADQGRVVKLENVTYNGTNFSDGVNTITIDTRFYSPTLVSGNTYNLSGIVFYGNNVIKIMPRKEADVEAQSVVVIPTAANLAALKDADRGTYILTLDHAVVTYVNGKNAFIEDATAGALIFIQDHGYNAGNCLTGDYQVNTTDYQGKFEITAIEAQAGAETTTAEIPLTTVSIATLNANFASYESRRVKIVGANVTDAISGSDRNGAISDGAALAVYAAVASTITLTADDNVDIIGYPGFHNTDQQLNVWRQEDITVNASEPPVVDTRKVAESPAAGFSSISGDLSGNEISFAAYQGGAATAPNGSNKDNELRLYKYQATTEYGGYLTITAKSGCTIDQVVITVSANCSVGWCKDAEELPTKESTPISVSTSSPFDTGTGLNASSVSVVNLHGSNQFKITSITVYYTGEAITLQSVAISGTASVLEYTEGQDFNPAGLVVTGHYSDNSDAVISEGITWTFDPSPLTVGTTSVNVTATVGSVTSSAFPVNGLIVNEAVTPPTPAGPENVVILATYGNKLYAMSNTQSSDKKSFLPVEVEEDGANIVVPSAEAKAAIQWTKTAVDDNFTFQDANDKYLKGASNGGDLTLDDEACNWTWDESTDYHCYATGDRSFIYRASTYNVFKNYKISNITGNNTEYAGVEVRVIAAENIVVTSKVDPELAYDPTSVELTVGDDFTPATLTYAEGFNGLAAVTYESSNLNLATVEGGVVSLVADATGTATITATFPGNTNYLAGSASYTITVNEPGDDLSGTWKSVTAVAAGQKIIIAGTYNSKTMAMGQQNSNNRAAVLSTLDGDILTPGTTAKVFTLVDAGEGLFAIQASNGKYLYAAGTGDKNYLKEADDFEEVSAKWTITFDANGANVVASSSNRNTLRYNSTNNSELFSCYAAGSQRPINIYSTTEVIRDGLEAGKWGTICPSYEIQKPEGASFYTLTYADKNGDVPSAVYFDEIAENASLEAGKPYLFIANGAAIIGTKNGEVTSVLQNYNGFTGVLAEYRLYVDADDAAAHKYYIIKGNRVQLCGEGYFTVPAERAYIDMSTVPTQPVPQMAGRRRVCLTNAEAQIATGLDALNADEAPVKMIINGQLFILRGEKMYNVNGQLVK